jgi:transcriptional regulator with XRE-family HTH domain
MIQKELIDAAMTASQITSLRGLAKETGIDVGSLSKWANGEREITLEGALILAKMAELRPEAIAGQMVKPRTNSRILKQVLKDWAKVAAALLFCTSAICETRHSIHLYNSTSINRLYIMSNAEDRKRRLARHLPRRRKQRIWSKAA